jgi:flagellar assembly factor FliW
MRSRFLMSTLTVESSRFGTIEIASDALIEFPAGLIGLGGGRYALVSADAGGAFHWLHSIDDPSLALPVTNPWLFFSDYVVDLSDGDTARVGSENPDVWVTVRAGSSPADFSANLRAPILVADGRGHQVINEASDAPVRAPLFPEASIDQAA